MIWQPYVDKVRLIRPDDLIRLFHLDERSGSSAKDYSPYARTGTYNGPTLLDAIQPCGLNATDFDGINDYVDIISNLNTDWSVGDKVRGTILMWLEKDWDVADKQTAIHLITNMDNQIQLWTPDAGGGLYVWSVIGGTQRYVLCSLSGTGWHSFVMTWDTTIGVGDYVEGWRDGVSQGTDTGAGSDWSGSLVKGLLGIDQSLTKWEWDGHIGVTAIWKDVLTDDEIKQISRI